MSTAWYVKVFTVISFLYVKMKGLDQVFSQIPPNLRCTAVPPPYPPSGTQVQAHHTHTCQPQ